MESKKGIWSPNHLEWIETQVGFQSSISGQTSDWCLELKLKTRSKFAAAKAGLILVNLNPSYTASELAFVLEKCKIKTIICDNKYRKILIITEFNMANLTWPAFFSYAPGGSDVTVIFSVEDFKIMNQHCPAA